MSILNVENLSHRFGDRAIFMMYKNSRKAFR